MLPPRACVAAEQGLKEKYMKPATAATLAQGDRTALGRHGKSPSLAKTVTAAAWSVKANNGSYRTDGTYSDGSVPSYGVRLLVLAAEWRAQAFLGG